MKITYYEPDNLQSCTELFISVYNNETWKCRWTEGKAKKYLQELVDTPRFVGFLLHDDDEELIGAAMCQERTWWYRDELHIIDFFIDPKWQIKGSGSHLLKFMEKHVKERELSGITSMTNNLDLAEFYQKNKFHYNDILFMYKGVPLEEA